jgi:hypothetical protein
MNPIIWIALGAFQASTDTSRPPVPPDFNLPEKGVLVVPHPDDERVVYYRNVLLVAFADTTKGVTIRALLKKYRGVIIGGAPYVGSNGAYVIRIPDVGASFAKLDSVITQLEREPGVSEATWITYKGLIQLLKAPP